MKSVVEYNKEFDLCCGCGLCTKLCPHNNLSMVYNEDVGRWEPQRINSTICEYKCNGVCVRNCPSYTIDNKEYYSMDNVKGRLAKCKILTGWSKNDDLRYNASSGGFIKYFAKLLINIGVVDGVISLKHEDRDEYIPGIYTNEADIEKMPNSIYHQVSFEKAFDILHENNMRFLVIGCPCHIRAIDNYVKRNHSLRKRVVLKIALICGGTFNRDIRNAFCHYKNSDNGFVVSYRNGGRYRKTKMVNDDCEQIYDIRKTKSILEEIDNMILMDKSLVQNACLYCVDHLGESADIVVGDAWTKKYNDDMSGVNLLIFRTDRAGTALSQIMAEGGFSLVEATIADIEEAQTLRYTYGLVGKYMRDSLFGFELSNEEKRLLNMEDVKLIHDKEVIRQYIRKKEYTKAKYVYCWQEKKEILFTFLRKITICRMVKNVLATIGLWRR